MSGNEKDKSLRYVFALKEPVASFENMVLVRYAKEELADVYKSTTSS